MKPWSVKKLLWLKGDLLPYRLTYIMARTQEATTDERTPLQKEIDRIEKLYGKGSIITSSSNSGPVEVISTGSLNLDLATGIWGLPRGKIVEFMGWESAGKSTIAMHVVANAQRKGLTALYIDGENSFDSGYAQKLGVDVDKLLINQLDENGGEKCYNILEDMLTSGLIGVAIVDSQTSLIPKKQIQEDVGTSVIGLQAGMMSRSIPKILNAARIGNTLVIYVSQFREKIGVMFGSPETTSGGNALKFYAHMRIDFRKSVLREKGEEGEDGKKEKGEAIANKTVCTIVKNKMARPFKKATFNINYGVGVDLMGEYVDQAVDLEIIQKNGSWYSFGENKIQGEEALMGLIADNPEFYTEIQQLVIQKLKDENTI